MVRAPCCEKMGLKKGPWSPEEDQILINYIQLYGHGNWRALPKQAGLLRCGKSCRLRWFNYLRPDIKRGNFTREEEEMIVQLHKMLGNRWSAIAARLPGRTDNEIKNVWHTYLKKRLKQIHSAPQVKQRAANTLNLKEESKPQTLSLNLSSNLPEPEARDSCEPSSPQRCLSDISSSVTTIDTTYNNTYMKVETLDYFPEMEENFWPEVLSTNNPSVVGAAPLVNDDFLLSPQVNDDFLLSPLVNAMEPAHADNSSSYETMEFWHTLLMGVGELPELSEIWSM